MIPDFDILDMRVLHFEKLLPRHDHDRVIRTETKKEGLKRVYQRFCSLGYYDQMSYVRAKDEAAIFNYKHCFLIKYPYQQGEQRMVADQMFTLLNDKNNPGNDPFEISSEQEMPFLGIILLTVGSTLSDPKETQTDSVYEELLKAYKNASTELLDQTIGSEGENGCYRLFYTPNCADLCIVIRTNNLQDIYTIKEQISEKNIDEKGGICHTTSYTLFQLPEKMWSDALIEKNKELWLEMRLDAPEDVMKKIGDCLKNTNNGNIYGITGSGQYALELNFAVFASVYPFIWEIKAGSDEKTTGFKEAKTDLQRVFRDCTSSIKCSYMRVKYQPHYPDENPCNNANGLCQTAQQLVEKYEDNIVSFTKEQIAKGGYQVSSLKKQKILMRELYYTYNDFWFRPTSWWKGVVFYAQLEGIMNGVRQYEYLASKTSRSPEALIKLICQDLEQAIFSVNSFNKLLQSVNQYVVNIPNYEMQTKVNIEKYLMAYTMYLFELSSNYYKKHGSEGVERILPFFLLDFNASNLEAYVLFGKKTMMPDTNEPKVKREEEIPKPWTTLVAVKCPNYQWFANVYHVLPMITHEMSHNFRYLPQKERNDFVFQYIITHLSKYMMEKILENSGAACQKMHYGNRERFFLKHIKLVIGEKLKPCMEQYSKSMKLQDLGVYLRKDFLKITGLYEYLYQENHTDSLIYEELLYLFQLIKMPYIRPEDLKDDSWNRKIYKLKGQELFFNILLDLLHPAKGREMCMEWNAALNNLEEARVLGYNKKFFQSIKNLLAVYEKEGIPSEYILVLPTKLVEIWQKYDGQLRKLIETDERIKNITEALKQKEIFKAQKLLNDTKQDNEMRASNIRVDIQTEYYEKLSEFTDYYGNIYTRIQTNYLDFISPRTDNDPSKVFAQDVHRLMHKEYIKILDSRYAYANRWITYKKNQELLTSLGIINENAEQFVDNYIQALRRITDGDLQTIIKDQIQNYEEVFADYGMCKAFSFTAYGYFMYLIHIFMKVREVPRAGLKDLTADRIRTLLLSYYKNEIDDFNSKLQEFWKDLKQALQAHEEELSAGYHELCKVDDFKKFSQKNFDEFMMLYHETDSSKEKRDEKLDREFYKQVWILRWASFLYRGLQLDIELEDWEDKLVEKLYKHVLYVDESVDNDKFTEPELWIRMCREDKNLKDIGEYYNNYTYSSVMSAIRNGRCLKHQNQFVFEYYKKMFDCIHSMKAELNRPENISKEILDLLFENRHDSLAKEGE